VDGTVETSNGNTIHLASLWGKPTVLFYEDRDSTQINQHVKEALTLRGQRTGLAQAVAVVAVANVQSFNFFPARNFVLAAVRNLEKRFSLPVYLDFRGSLTEPPTRFPAKGSTVVVLDAAGQALKEWRGPLTSADVEQLFSTLEGLIH
jgi:hypothetical protein